MANALQGKDVYLTGAGGFLGKYVKLKLEEAGATVYGNRLDLTRTSLNPPAKPDLLVHLAADVSGISLNRQHPYRFFANNSRMTLTVVRWLGIWGDVPVVAAGSICAYPNDAPLPFSEPDFWQGKPDPNNLGYGMAKRFLGGALESAAAQWGQRYAHLIMANLYGPADHFDEETSHVIPSLIRRMDQAMRHEHPEFAVWGTGNATRDFLYVEDAADAYVTAAEVLLQGSQTKLECNLGSGTEVTIAQTVQLIASAMNYGGTIVYDKSKPDGQMRRLVNTRNAQTMLGWSARTPLREGVQNTVGWYKDQYRP